MAFYHQVINFLFLSSAFNYDVFLSFRGKDTRTGFIDHLYLALTDAGFRVFRDDKGIRVGQNFDAEIRKAIQESKTSVVVFSEDYASSKWCLEELVMIMERRRNDGHGVVPIFYEVGRYEVAEQTGRYGDSFAKHEKVYESEKVEEWRVVLGEAADLEGMLLNDRSEGEFVKEIVAEIKKVTQAAHPWTFLSLYPLTGWWGPFRTFFFLKKNFLPTYIATSFVSTESDRVVSSSAVCRLSTKSDRISLTRLDWAFLELFFSWAFFQKFLSV